MSPLGLWPRKWWMKLSNVHRQIHSRCFPFFLLLLVTQSVPVFDPRAVSPSARLTWTFFNPFWHLKQKCFPPSHLFLACYIIIIFCCKRKEKKKHNSLVFRHDSKVHLLTRFYFAYSFVSVGNSPRQHYLAILWGGFCPPQTGNHALLTCQFREKLMTVCDILTTPSWKKKTWEILFRKCVLLAQGFFWWFDWFQFVVYKKRRLCRFSYSSHLFFPTLSLLAGRSCQGPLK